VDGPGVRVNPQRARTVQVRLPPLLPWQVEVAQDAARYQVLCNGRRSGKALSLDTPVPTPTGWSTMGKLRDGDELFDERGEVCRVLHAHPVLFERRCYRVVFSDGSEIVADSDHLWVTQTSVERKRQLRGVSQNISAVRTTEEIAQTLTIGSRGDTNHSISVSEALKLPDVDLPIHPWVLGFWLGDGSSNSSRIHAGDHDELEIRMQFMKFGFITGPVRRDRGVATFNIGRGSFVEGRDGRLMFADPLTPYLRGLEVLNNKHIPTIYLRSSADQRLQLLQGLIDSDGYVKNGHVEFCTTSRLLADGAHEIALSLGLKATLREGRAKIDGRDCGPKYRVCFTTSMRVCRLGRKEDGLRDPATPRSQQQYRRYIKSVEPVESVPVRCVTVDSPNKLYLVGRSMIPTHNTAFGLIKAIAAAMRGQRVFWVGKVHHQSEKVRRDAKEILKHVSSSVVRWRDVDKMMITANGGEIHFRSADKPDNLRGDGLHGAVLDEADFMDRATWFDAIRPALSDKQGWAMFLSTPKRMNGWFHKLYKRGVSSDFEDRAYRCWRLPTWANPNIPPEEIEEAKRDLGENSIEFRREYGAEFVNVVGAKIQRDWVQEGNPPARQRFTKVVAAADLAISTKKGASWTAVVVMGLTSDRTIWVLDAQRKRISIGEQPEFIKEVADPWSPDAVGVEKTLHGDHIVDGVLDLVPWPVWPIPVRADKESRFAPLESRYARKRVWHAHHVPEVFCDELCSFPESSHDDQIDAASIGFSMLGDRADTSGGYVPKGSRRRRPPQFRC